MRGYDGNVLRREVKGKYIIVRPDRIIFAACMDIGELEIAMRELEGMFYGKRGGLMSARL
jgi:hypothetical protein